MTTAQARIPRQSGADSPLNLYARDVRRTPLLGRDDEAAVIDRAVGGDGAARELLVRSHLRLVMRLARRYLIEGIDVMDLIGAGNYGLLRAVGKFDRAVGKRFTTYAGHWIKREIRRELDRRPIVHVTNNAYGLIDQVDRQDDPAAYLASLPVNEQAIYRRACEGVASTATAARFGHYERADAFEPTGRELDPAAGDWDGSLTRAIDSLPARLRGILIAHHGLGSEEPQTLADIGRDMGLSRERIRQLNEKAEERLRQEFARQRIAFDDVA